MGSNGTKLLPSPGSEAMYIPKNNENCLSCSECTYVYNCIDSNNPVQPSFCADYFNRPEETVQTDPVDRVQCMLNWSILSPHLEYTDVGPTSHTTPATIKKPPPDLPPSIYDPKPHDDIYHDRYDHIECTVKPTKEFNEETDITTTFLGDTKDMRGKFSPHKSFCLNHACFALGKFPDGRSCPILVDTGATRSIMSKGLFERLPCLHPLPKLKSRCSGMYIGNGQVLPVCFVIPIIVVIDDQCFEIFTYITDTTESTLFLFGYKSLTEIEGNICSRSGKVHFYNRSPLVYPVDTVTIPPKAKRTVTFVVDFPEEISGVGVFKSVSESNVGGTRHCLTHTQKVVVKRNHIAVTINNSENQEKVVYDKNDSIGILDLRSLGYFHISHTSLERSLAPSCTFMDIQTWCREFNTHSAHIDQWLASHPSGSDTANSTSHPQQFHQSREQ